MIMKRLLLATFVALAFAAGCGGSSQLASNTNDNARPSATSLERSPLRVTLENGTVIALDPSGLITVDGERLGDLQPDGRVTGTDGADLAALLADGQIQLRGAPTPFRIVADRLEATDSGHTLVAVVPPDHLAEMGPDGTVRGSAPVIGLTPTNHATVLFVVTTAVLELSAAALEAPGEASEDGQDGAYDADAEPSGPLRRVPIDGAPQRGPSDALVTVVVFSDFQCPFCSRVVPTLQGLLERYGNDVRLVFRHHPLPFHANAPGAAEASMEAFAQRGAAGFWQMHDLLFENQSALEPADLERYAQVLGLDMARFRLAMSNHTHEGAIQADLALASRLGVAGTPTFFVNGRELVGAQPREEFERVIDAARSDARRRLAGGVPRARLYDAIVAEGLDRPPAPPPVAPSAPEDEPGRRWAIGDGAGSPARGPRRAPVTIQVFSDFQCPFCARAAPTLERLLGTYGRRVRVVFRHYPLPFHDWAEEAAELSLEIQRQRGDAGFWQFHDLVFENQGAVRDATSPREGLLALARQVRGVNLAQCERALDQHTHAAAVQADMDAVRTAGAQIGTPSFFINGRLVQGAQPYESFQRVIDEELAAPDAAP
jgi:protein-disulfide isomerase